MARCVGIYIGLVIATFIRFSIFCSELYILFSPVAMWYYILFSFVIGTVTATIKNKREREQKEMEALEKILRNN